MVGEHPPLSEREIAVIRGWAAEHHRRLHAEKNASADRGVRDAISEDMREIESIGEKLGRLL